MRLMSIRPKKSRDPIAPEGALRFLLTARLGMANQGAEARKRLIPDWLSGEQCPGDQAGGKWQGEATLVFPNTRAPRPYKHIEPVSSWLLSAECPSSPRPQADPLVAPPSYPRRLAVVSP
jgi:hypothetical protein